MIKNFKLNLPLYPCMQWHTSDEGMAGALDLGWGTGSGWGWGWPCCPRGYKAENKQEKNINSKLLKFGGSMIRLGFWCKT